MLKNKKPAPRNRSGLSIAFIQKLKHSLTPIQIEPVPPPSYAYIEFHIIYASAFFLATFFALGAASAEPATFFEAVLFNLVLIDFLFLDTPKEPIVRFPFFDFLSPRPMLG
jgi:hypothetical protein